MRVRIRPLGDQGLCLTFGDGISPRTQQAVRRFCLALARAPVPGLVEWVPAYATVAVYYRPWDVSERALRACLHRCLRDGTQAPVLPATLTTIPTCYGGAYGPDLDEVARLHRLTPADVVALHSRPDYLIHMLGFVPGFAYLGGLPPRIATPRLAVPRLAVPAGSVALAGAQTGIYPLETPAGWRILGRTPLILYDPARRPAALLQAGDFVRFAPISPEDYERIAEDVRGGTYALARCPIGDGNVD